MEAVGLAVGLVGLFSTCLETVQRIDSYKTAGRDSRLLGAQLNATMHLFERWGDSVGIGKGQLSDNHHPALDDPKTFSVIKNLLQSFEEFSAAITTHDATGPKAIQRVPSFQLPDPLTKNPSKTSRWQKTSWALRGKLKQTNHVDALTTLVSELYTVVSPETAVVASVGPKTLSTTDSFISQHNKVLVSDQNHGSSGQPCDVRAVLLEFQQELKAEALPKLRAWLGGPPPNHVYTESKDKRLQKTCEWMLHRQEFLNWQAPSTSDKLLWIKGPAGFGKTVLCSRLVEEVEKTTDRPMAYFFLSSKFEGRDDPFSAIRSWLTTMISKNAVALDTIRRHHVPEYEQVASQATILQLFHDMVNRLPGCTFILDGLDECTGMNGSDSKSVTCFLEQLNKAISNTGTRLLITSRGDPIIQQGLSSFPGYTEYSIQAADVGPDLAIYSSEVVEARLSNKDEATREFIAQKIKDRCQGQFQWIKLQEGSLRKGRSKRQLEREIDETPSGLDGLYDREWSRIMAMGATDRDRALCLLRWAAFSIRPLTVYEITEAVLMTDDCEEFPHDEMPDSIDKDYVDSMILDLCGSLVEVRHSAVNDVERKQNSKSGDNHENIDRADLPKESLVELDVGFQEVHLTHFSVKEYLLPRISPNHADSLLNKGLRVSLERFENMVLCRYCLRYLNLPGTWDEWQMGPESTINRFLFYAATFWLAHYDMAETPDINLRNEVNAFFDDQNTSFCLWRRWWDTYYPTSFEGTDISLLMGPFELAIMLELKDVVKHMIYKRNHDPKSHLEHNMTALHYACMVGEQEIAELLLERGAELDIMRDEGETPLLLAIAMGNSHVAEFLISRGANIVLSNSHGKTPLHLASAQGDLKIVKQLIENGAEIAASTKDGFTPLLSAAANGQSEVVKMLLDGGADLSDADEDGYTSLHLASVDGHYNLIKQLIDLGADMEALLKDGHTPLEVAAASGHSQVVSLLLESGANLHQWNEDGLTPLTLASAGGHFNVVKILLEHGADCREENQKGCPSLQVACENGHSEVVKLLLDEGADWRCVGEEGWTAIYSAALNNHVDVVDILLNEGASFNAIRGENNGFSLLCAAISGDSLELAKLIIDKGASVEEKWIGTYEATPLFLASSLGQLEMAELLLARGADVNAVSEDLATPLYEASVMGHYDIAKLLIQKGANAAVKDLFGQSALFYAVGYGHKSVAELLATESHSKLTATDNWSRTPLHYACKGGHLEIVKWMLGLLQKTPAVIDKADYWSSTPLSMAVRKGHASVVKLLLDTHVIDIDSTDKFGRTLVWWATEQGHSEVLRLLTEQNQSWDLDAEVEAGEDQVCRFCDICCLNISSGDYHNCETCHGGDFDVCPACFKLGGSCFDDLHSLVLRTVEEQNEAFM